MHPTPAEKAYLTPAEQAAAEKRELEKASRAKREDEEAAVAPLLRFADLKRLNIVDNWVTLREWQRTQNFPAGILLGPNTRAWTAPSIAEWLASRPTTRATTDINEDCSV